MMSQTICLLVLIFLTADVAAFAQGRGDPGGAPGPGRGRGSALPQGPAPTPPRDTGRQPQTGTARLSGRVLAAETGSPLRRAQVRITAPEVRENRVAITDSEGRYAFADLRAGRYTLTVSKGGYIALQYGQVRPFEPGKPLEIADGRNIERIDFALPRGSVIAGRVADEFGEPVAEATVQAMRYQFANGERRLTTVGRAITSDDIGQFRIFGLAPGEYLVRASVRNFGGVSADDVERSGYPSTYYPGTNDVAEAQLLNVSLGQELSSVHFSLVPARLSRISGAVVDSHGVPLERGIVALRQLLRGAAPIAIGGETQIGPNGTFTLPNVAPGEYLIEVTPRPRDRPAEIELASVPLTVNGDDVPDLAIVTTTGISVSGRVMYQGNAAPTGNQAAVRVVATTPPGMPSVARRGGQLIGEGRAGEDGGFELRGLFGPQIIRVPNPPTGWALKSVTVGGEDITDSAHEFKGETSRDALVVTMTDRVTDLSGTVKDGRDQPLGEFVVVIFPDNERYWTGQSRFIRTARPDQEGRYLVRGLPPARYLAVAIDSLEPGTQNDPSVLGQLRRRATGFSVVEGQTLTLDLDYSGQP